MNYFKRAVFAVMAIFPLLSLAACNSSKEEAVARIESYLEQKYGEDFEVTGIGGGYGTRTTNTLKANVQPKDKPDLKFKAEITKDHKEIWDSYMNAVMAHKLDDAASKLAKPIFSSELNVKTQMSSPGLAFPDRKLNDKKMGVAQYLEQYPKNTVNIDIFVRASANVDPDAEEAKVDQLADKIITEGIKKTNIHVFYLKPEAFAELNEKYNEFNNLLEMYKYYSDQENSVLNARMEIKDGKKQQSIGEIINHFKS